MNVHLICPPSIMLRRRSGREFVSRKNAPLSVRVRLATAVLIAASSLLAACTNPDNPLDVGDGRNLIRMQSDAGDVVGGGRSYEYTLANSVITVDRGGGRFLTVQVTGDERWTINFSIPGPGSKLRAGTYVSPNAYDITVPRLAISQISAGCEGPIGQFTISNVEFSPDSLLDAVDATFEQRCPGATAALRGSIHWRSNDVTRPPGPATIPSSLWQPPPGPNPRTGNYIYLVSEPGDYVGQGRTNGYVLTNPSVQVVWIGHSFEFGNFGEWAGRFVMPNSVAQAEVGYYTGLQAWPFFNPTRGSVEWGVEGRTCAVTNGWLAIDAVTYKASGAIDTLDLRFEQRCQGSTGALHGVVHVGQ